MFEFGDDYIIPWLIWIQIFVIFLLIVLLYLFSILALDLSDTTTTTTSTTMGASSSSSGFFINDIEQIEKPIRKHNTNTRVVTNRSLNPQGGRERSIKGEIATSTSRRIANGEEIMEGVDSLKYHHPCHYFKLAKLAFLKCFGLESTSDNLSNQKHRKRKES
ncbi:Transmembrane protein [Quillaja saponaria]|uniref:Transmembrane protein n=1 Tax=Quillaja saponaria TaxID=32244 RepID=A0AAD7KT77_QUISA|nr:Transmembrane protein [Quillaja saponaria]